ncbi:MAG: Sua5/YciO/YrdC/YwlC family protein [Saprospirales bacterium]|nr:Sua5/YciO/YrdC/YwlC family protein [Saprospirales bacterium]MBK8922346.1 Sua5/YciO/YrdC/YwlC family protein [Saprospirales bacterium]
MFLLRDDISDIVRLLGEGGVICYPTDTIWGIGCDATNETAVTRLSALKGHAPEKGYILLVDSLEMLKRYVSRIHPRIETLLAYHQRPLSVIYEHVHGLPASVKNSNGSVAIRLTRDEFCCALIGALGRPLVSTAAAKHGEPYPPTFGAISSEILGGVDYVVKYRQDDKEPHEPSAIAYLDRHKELEFIRE